jgi:hypothetical protein
VAYDDLSQPNVPQVKAFVTEAVNKLEGKPTVTPATVAS